MKTEINLLLDMALQGILANEELRYQLCRPNKIGVAGYAIEQADELLKQLDTPSESF